MNVNFAIEPAWIREAGVDYRRDTDRTPLHACETLLYYTWHYHPNGEEGTAFVVLNTPTAMVARRHLQDLLGRWNEGCPSLWSYREGSGAKVYTTH